MTMCAESIIIVNSPLDQVNERDDITKEYTEVLAKIFKDKLAAAAKSPNVSYRVSYRRMMHEFWPHIIRKQTSLPFTWDASDLQKIAEKTTEIFKKEGTHATIHYNRHTTYFSLKLPRYS